MKKCSKCGQNKNVDEFAKNKSRSDGVQNSCKPCHRQYMQAHYIANKRYYKDKARRINNAIIVRNKSLVAARWVSGCIDCGVKDFRVLEFDHTGTNKSFTIGHSMWKNETVMIEELAKCDVVCANCHKVRTENRSPSWRSRLGSDAGGPAATL